MIRPSLAILILAASAAWLAPGSSIAQEGRAGEPTIQEIGRKYAARRAAIEQAQREMAERARQNRLLGLSRQLRSFYRFELMHVRAACGLLPDELRAIRPALDAAYKSTIVGLDSSLNGASPTAGSDGPDYVEAIRGAIHPIVEARVGRDRFERLRADLRARQAARKKAGVPMLVAVLDRDLLLTADQRQQLADRLAGRWEDRWSETIEAASNGQTCRPDLPDDLADSILSESQRDRWRQLPRITGRLWGVVVDHGGGPAIEEELGADPARQTVLRPMPPIEGEAKTPLALALAEALAQPVGAQTVAVRVVKLPAVAIVKAVDAGQDQDPGAGEDAAAVAEQKRRERLQIRERALLRSFDLIAIGAVDEASAVEAFETALSQRVDDLGRAAGLGEAETKKLRAAGHGDIKRFLDHHAEERSKYVQAVGAGVIRVDRAGLRNLGAERINLLAVEGPIFARTLARVMTDDRRAALDRDDRDRRVYRFRAAIGWTTVLLARSLGMLDGSRRRLELLLLDRAETPAKFDSLDDRMVMYQASRIPEEILRPIFDDLQWRILRQELDAAHRWEPYMRNGGFFEVDEQGLPALPDPPIRILAPPPIRNPFQ